MLRQREARGHKTVSASRHSTAGSRVPAISAATGLAFQSGSGSLVVAPPSGAYSRTGSVERAPLDTEPKGGAPTTNEPPVPIPSCPQSLGGHPQGVAAGGFPLKDCGNDENSTIAGMMENSTEGWGSLAQRTRAARVGFSG